MTTITKRNLAVLNASEKISSSVYHLDHVKLENNYLWASNGHSLYGSPITNHPDYLDCAITGAVEHKEGCILLQADVFKKAASNIPNHKTLPVVNCINLLIDDTHKHLVTTDLQTVNDVKIPHGENKEWPDHKMIIDNANLKNLPRQTVILATAELEILVEVLKQHDEDSVRLTIYGPEYQVDIATKTGLIGAIMPMLDF